MTPMGANDGRPFPTSVPICAICGLNLYIPPQEILTAGAAEASLPSLTFVQTTPRAAQWEHRLRRRWRAQAPERADEGTLICTDLR